MNVEKIPHVYDKLYVGLTPKQIHGVALERVAHYSKPAPHGLDGIYQLLRDAWESIARRHQEQNA